MSTNYPTSLDTTAVLKNDANDATVTSTIHAGAHNNVADSIIAIETELGVNPSGSQPTVAAFLNALDAGTVKLVPTSAQIIVPSGDTVALVVKLGNALNISNLFEGRLADNTIVTFIDRLGNFSAQSLKINGTLLNSTHLSDSAQLARLASPTFTGTPAAPTASPGDNTTKVATTAFVTAAVAAATPGAGSITESQLAKPAVGTPELYDNSVTTAKIPDGAVTTPKILDGAVTPAKLPVGTVAGGTNYGTAFPGSGLFNGYRFTLFVSDAAGGTIAHDYIYRADLNGTYPWVFVGGTPYSHLVDAGDGTSSTAYTALANAGPSITVARAGEYNIELGSVARGSGAGYADNTYHSFDIGATGASDADAVNEALSSGGTVAYANGTRLRRKIVGAGTAFVSKYRVGGGTQTDTFDARWMKITPVRNA